MNYFEHMAEGNRLLGLAEIYSEDGAPSTAALRAREAAEHFEKATQLRIAALTDKAEVLAQC